MARFLIPLLSFVVLHPAMGAERRYPEAKAGKGELKYVDGVPVLFLEGTPEEIGRQFATLAIVPAKKPLIGKVDDYMKQIGWEKTFPTMLKLSGLVYTTFPREYQKELSAAAKTSGVDRDLLTAFQAIPDLAKMGGCSTLVVEPTRSATGAPIFGRNLDWPPFEDLPDWTLVTVVRSKDRRAFASVTLPVLIGTLSGMNDAGLSLAINEITASKDKSPSRNLSGTPMLLLFRKILEECTTVEEAEKVLRAHDRTTWYCLTVCDTKGGCVFEITPKTIVKRSAENHCCCCTNHFRTDELSVTKTCGRYPKLAEVQKAETKLGLAEVANALDAVNQGPSTMQSMIFEPKARVVHVAYGSGKSATARPMTKLDVGAMFERK